jgi:hypothetical protein
MSGGVAQNPARAAVLQLAVSKSGHTVDEYVIDTAWKAVRLIKISLFADLLGIENDDVSPQAFAQQATISKAKSGRCMTG